MAQALSGREASSGRDARRYDRHRPERTLPTTMAIAVDRLRRHASASGLTQNLGTRLPMTATMSRAIEA